MFKSKAQKEAEHRLKVEAEIERIRQRKEAAQRQKEAAIAWVNASPDNRNLILTGIAGLFTGGIAGAIFSPIAFRQYNKRINNSAMKWLAWAGTGLIAAPILIGAQAAMFGGGTEPQSITAKNKVTQVEETKTVAAAPETTLSPSAEATPAPVSTPKPLTPEEKFAQTLTSKTDGIFAIEAVSILAPHYYENRHELWSAISGISPSESEYLVAEALKQQALSNDLPWDDNQIQKMSKGIVAGFYKWNLENPGDL